MNPSPRRSEVLIHEKSHDLTRRSFELGAVSALDLSQSETLLEGARAERARYLAVVSQDENALALLAGILLRAEWLPETLGEPTAAVAEMTAGVPSDVLVRRPDICAAW
ncbi:MAG: hypothetical protein AB1713_02340 [Pseudomonadota bacterium]